jgi:hypothetical protein
MLLLPSCVVQIIGERKEHEGLWRHDRRMLIGTAVGTKPPLLLPDYRVGMGAVIDEANRRQLVDHLVNALDKTLLSLEACSLTLFSLPSVDQRQDVLHRSCLLRVLCPADCFQRISYVLHSSSPMSLHYATTWSERLTVQRMLQYRMRVALGVSRIELVHQHLSVRLDPALDSLARLHPEDLYPRRRNKPTAGGSAHELAFVRPSIRPTYDYPVSLRDDILHRCDEVREGRAVSNQPPAIVVGTLYREI